MDLKGKVERIPKVMQNGPRRQLENAVETERLLSIWEDATGRRLDPSLRDPFLDRPELKEIAKSNIAFIEETAR